MSEVGRTEALYCVISGRVQAVGFRAFVVARARSLGLTGWVRNRPDGRSVELWAEGTPEALAALRVAARRGPAGARVEDAECEGRDSSGAYADFSVRR